MFASLLGQSMIKSAIDNGVVRVSVVNIRDFATDKHQTADDYPFGGGPGHDDEARAGVPRGGVGARRGTSSRARCR